MTDVTSKHLQLLFHFSLKYCSYLLLQVRIIVMTLLPNTVLSYHTSRCVDVLNHNSAAFLVPCLALLFAYLFDQCLVKYLDLMSL